MKPKEAIIQLMCAGGQDQLVVDALDLAIEALEKQTPKKPVKADEQVVRYVTTWNCPTCGGQFTGMVSNYCYHCGQALAWEYETEQ